MDLASKQCVPCKGGVPPLRGEELERLHKTLGNGWEVVNGHHLTKEFRFKNFREALDCVNLIGGDRRRAKASPGHFGLRGARSVWMCGPTRLMV